MDHVLKLPYIPWPVICLEKLCSPFIDASNPFAGVRRIALNEVLGEQQDVFTLLTKRGDMDRKDVLAAGKRSRRNSPAPISVDKIAVSGCYDAHVSRGCSDSTDPLEFAFLKHTQQGDFRVSAGISPISSRKKRAVVITSKRPARR